MPWTVTFYSRRVEDGILALPAGFVARFLRYAESLEAFGPDLGMPHTRALGGGMFELRIKAAEGIARVFFCTVVDRRIVFLHQFVRKTARTPPKELQIAQRRRKDVTHDSHPQAVQNARVRAAWSGEGLRRSRRRIRLS